MKNQPGTMKNQPGTMKNQPGTMKTQPGTMKIRENRSGTIENQPRKIMKTNLEPLAQKTGCHRRGAPTDLLDV